MASGNAGHFKPGNGLGGAGGGARGGRNGRQYNEGTGPTSRASQLSQLSARADTGTGPDVGRIRRSSRVNAGQRDMRFQWHHSPPVSGSPPSSNSASHVVVTAASQALALSYAGVDDDVDDYSDASSGSEGSDSPAVQPALSRRRRRHNAPCEVPTSVPPLPSSPPRSTNRVRREVEGAARVLGIAIGPRTAVGFETAAALKKRRDAETKTVRARGAEVETARGASYVASLAPVPTSEQLAHIFPGTDSGRMWSLQNAIRRWQLGLELIEVILCAICKRSTLDDCNGALKGRNGDQRPAYDRHYYAWTCSCAAGCVPMLASAKPRGQHRNLQEVLICRACKMSATGKTKEHPLFSKKNGIYFPAQSPLYDNVQGRPRNELLPKPTLQEIALIARVTPIMHCSSLKFGNRKIKGHVALVENGITVIADILPRLGSECAWIVVRVGSVADYVEFRVRRDVVEMWLLYLTKFSPAYVGVTIDMSRIPLNGIVSGVRVVVASDDSGPIPARAPEAVGEASTPPIGDDGPALAQLGPNDGPTFSGLYNHGHAGNAVQAELRQQAGLVGGDALAAGLAARGDSADGAALPPVAGAAAANPSADDVRAALSPRRRSSTDSLRGAGSDSDVDFDSADLDNSDEDCDSFDDGAQGRAVPFLTNTTTDERIFVSMEKGRRPRVWCWTHDRIRAAFRLDSLLERKVEDAFRSAEGKVPIAQRAAVYRESMCALTLMREHGDDTYARHQPHVGGAPVLPDFGGGVQLATHFPARLQNTRCATLLNYFAAGLRASAMENGALFGQRGCTYVGTYSAEVIACAMYVVVYCANWSGSPPARRRRCARTSPTAAAAAVAATACAAAPRRIARARRPFGRSAPRGNGASSASAPPVPTDEYVAPRQERVNTAYVDMQKEGYAMAMVYPQLFLPDHANPLPQRAGEEPHSLCEIPSCFTVRSARGKQPTFAEWVAWVFSAGAGALARHPTAKFVLLNILRRSQAMQQGSYSIKTGTDSTSMTMDELREQVAAGNFEVLHKIQHHQANITGTPQYWKSMRGAASALVREKFFENDEVCVAFHTGSCAEFHARDLHRVLQRVLTAEAKTDEQRRIAATLLDDASASKAALHKAVRDHQHVVTSWFHIRTRSWFDIVLREGLGVTDFWGRYEFAKSRGAIHFHAIIWAAGIQAELAHLLDAAAKALDGDALTAKLDAAAESVNALATRLGITALHPAGPDDSNPAEDNTEWHRWEQTRSGKLHVEGNFEFWPHPEGRRPKPAENVLKTMQLFLAADGWTLDLINLVNRILLHSCSLYCWKTQKKKKKKKKATAAAASGAPAAGGGASVAAPPVARNKPHSDCTLDHCAERPCHCRVGMGSASCPVMHPWTKKTRTYGLEPQPKATLGMVGGVLKLKQQRNHPRLVQGLQCLLQAWRANMDFQLILCAAMMPTIKDLVKNLPREERDAARATLQKLRSTNQWMCPAAVMQRIVDYVVAYSTKASATSGEMKTIFLGLAAAADGSTSLSSFASKFICGVLKKLEVTSQEASHQLAQNPLTFSSLTRKLVSLGGARRVRAAAGNDNSAGDTPLEKANDFDKFCKRPVGDTDMCFDAWLRSRLVSTTKTSRIKGNGVDHFTWSKVWSLQYVGKPTRLSIPLSDDYCLGVLLRFRRGIRSFKDARAPFEDGNATGDDGADAPDAESNESNSALVDLFLQFLTRPECPQKLTREHELERDRTDSHVSRAPKEGARVSQSPTPPRPEDLDEDEELVHRIQGAVVADPAADLASLKTGDSSTDWGAAGRVDGIAWPEVLETKLREVVAAHRGGNLTQLSLGKHSPVLAMDNEQQRMLLSIVLLHLKRHFDPQDSDPDVPLQLRLVLLGIAGTGKSFCIRNVVNFTTMMTLDTTSADVIAPTGTAACNAGGSTGQRSLGYNSVSAYEPLGVSKKATLQKKRDRTVVQLLDEISLFGSGQLGMVAHRLCELQHRGFYATSDPESFGNIPILIACGDILQLDAVLDTPVYKPGGSTSSNEQTRNLNEYGLRMYRKLSEDVLELTQSVRQEEGSELAAMLFALRCEDGPPSPASLAAQLAFWNGQALPFMVPAERRRFEDPRSSIVHATYTNRAAAVGNAEYLANFDLVLVAKQGASGAHAVSHAHRLGGMAKSIPRNLYVAKGALMRCTLNVLAEYGLHNGARGNIVGWKYPSALVPVCGSSPSIVIVDFPGWTGPPLCVFSRFACWEVPPQQGTYGALLHTPPAALDNEKPVLADSMRSSAADDARVKDIVARLRGELLAAIAANACGSASDQLQVPASSPLDAAVQQWVSDYATDDMPYASLGRVEAAVHSDGSSTVSVELVFGVTPGATATWVPLDCLERRCDCKQCTRTGFPLKVAKHTTLHGLQGLEVCDGGAMTGLVVNICPKDEAGNPGMTYVALSRIKELCRLALARSFTYESLKKLHTGERYVQRKAELERLRRNKSATVAKYTAFRFGGSDATHAIGTKRAYCDLLKWLVAYCRTHHGANTSREALLVLERCDQIQADLSMRPCV